MNAFFLQTDDVLFSHILTFIIGFIFCSLIFLFFRRRSNHKLKIKYEKEIDDLQAQKAEALSNNNIKLLSKNNEEILEKFYQQTLDKHKATTRTTWIASFIGFMFLLFMIVSVTNLSGDIFIEDRMRTIVGYISGISGAITSFISLAFINRLNKLEKDFQMNLERLSKESFISTRYSLIEELKNEDRRDEELTKLIADIGRKMK